MNQPTTEEIASYIKMALTAEWNGNLDNIELPKFPLDLLEECNFAVTQLIQAFQNQSNFFF